MRAILALVLALVLAGPVAAADGDTIGGQLTAGPGYVSATNLGSLTSDLRFAAECGRISPQRYSKIVTGATVTPTSTALAGWVSVTFSAAGATSTATLLIDLGGTCPPQHPQHVRNAS